MGAFSEGTPCWADVLLPDLRAGKRFYGELFDWTFEEQDGGSGLLGGQRAAPGSPAGPAPYTTAYRDGRRVAALAPKGDGRMPTTWNVYLATPDAVAAARRVTEAGGLVITDPVPLTGDVAVVAQAADPGGAVFSLWEAGRRHGFERQGEPGSFCWTEVYTRDKDRVDAFYETVFGFQVHDLDDASVDFRVWSPAGTTAGDENAVGGRSVITDAFPAAMPAHFLVYFSVADCDETAARATELGGRVNEPPFDTPYGRIALIADDQGAVFAVLAEPKAA
ncbi:VOC family protein [Streptomyces sp. ODS05-4]|uniref:VOC family protein n=1 Tax=Streptomyces sp. ODS05-4 TaxID=2944939 RepID=UPI00210D930D|nr:VOC family protein [Streptomyces sp. ODS05-4]